MVIVVVMVVVQKAERWNRNELANSSNKVREPSEKKHCSNYQKGVYILLYN